MQETDSLRAVWKSLAYATNSTASYQCSRNMYEAFLKRAPEWTPWTEDSVAAWLLDGLFNRCWKKNTLRTRMAGIANHFTEETGAAWNAKPGSTLHFVNRAIARLGADAEPKEPIKSADFKRILVTLKGFWNPGLRTQLLKIWPALADPQNVLEVVAWFTISWACFLRAEETASLVWDTIEFEDELCDAGFPVRAAIELTTSKFCVYKTMTSSVKIVMKRAHMVDICPVRALTEWVRRVVLRRDLSGPLFTLKVDQARKLLKCLAAHALGKSEADFGLHSLRAGAACSADEAGLNLATIMFLGRWRSAAVLAYLRSAHDDAGVMLLKGAHKGQDTKKGETRFALQM